MEQNEWQLELRFKPHHTYLFSICYKMMRSSANIDSKLLEKAITVNAHLVWPINVMPVRYKILEEQHKLDSTVSAFDHIQMAEIPWLPAHIRSLNRHSKLMVTKKRTTYETPLSSLFRIGKVFWHWLRSSRKHAKEARSKFLTLTRGESNQLVGLKLTWIVVRLLTCLSSMFVFTKRWKYSYHHLERSMEEIYLLIFYYVVIQ